MLQALRNDHAFHGSALFYDFGCGRHPDARPHGGPPLRGRRGEGLRPGHPVCHLQALWIHPIAHIVRHCHRLDLFVVEIDL